MAETDGQSIWLKQELEPYQGAGTAAAQFKSIPFQDSLPASAGHRPAAKPDKNAQGECTPAPAPQDAEAPPSTAGSARPAPAPLRAESSQSGAPAVQDAEAPPPPAGSARPAPASPRAESSQSGEPAARTAAPPRIVPPISGHVAARPVASGSPAQSPQEKQIFLDGVVRWTQAALESTFVEVCRRVFPRPIRPYIIDSPPVNNYQASLEYPPSLPSMMTRLEEFARHTYPFRPETSAMLLKALLVFGEKERALDMAGLLAAREKENVEFLYYHALSLYQMQRFDDAQTIAERAAAQDAASRTRTGSDDQGAAAGNALLLQALVLSRMGENASAGHMLAGAVSRLEGSASLLHFALPCLREAREYDALAQVIKMLLDLASKAEDPAQGEVIDGENAEAEDNTCLAVELIREFYAAEEYGALVQVYDRCLSLRSVLGKTDWYRFAIALAWHDREKEARAAFTKFLSPVKAPSSWGDLLRAVSKSERSDTALVLLIGRNFLKRRKPEACLEYCAALPRTSAGPRIDLLMVHCYIYMRNYEEALALLGAVEYDTGTRAEWQYLQGAALFFSGRKKEARDYLEKAVEAGAHVGPCWRLLGVICSETREHARAADYYKKLARSSGNDTEPVALYAFAALRAGKESLALEGFRELTARLPDCAEGWNNLGVLLARREEYEAAARSFRRALECVPGLREARKNLDLIREHVAKGRAPGQKEWFANLGLPQSGGGINGSRNSRTG